MNKYGHKDEVFIVKKSSSSFGKKAIVLKSRETDKGIQYMVTIPGSAGIRWYYEDHLSKTQQARNTEYNLKSKFRF